MQKITSLLFLISATILFFNCAGLRHISIETREPGKIDWSPNVLSVVVVNNVLQQPDHLGHQLFRLGQDVPVSMSASSENIARIYTEALAQFIDEEEHFEQVLFFTEPLRSDPHFFDEQPLMPAQMRELLRESGADAVISLDLLVMQTVVTEQIRQGGFILGEMVGHIHSTLRIYKPTMEGILPAVLYSDSLVWQGFDQSGLIPAYSDILPTREEAMHILAIHAAEQMTKTLSPHWETQTRWFYTTMSSRMREGAAFARGNQWDRALDRWMVAFNSARRVDKAKAANNVALAHEMLDDLETALEWANKAHELFERHTASQSLERRRSQLYIKELERRINNVTRLLDMSEF